SADGFGLGQVEAAVEEGAHGKFSGLGQAGALGQGEFDYVAQDYGGAVGGDFDDVVGGVGVGLGEVGDYDFVDAGGSCGEAGWCRALLGLDGRDARPHTTFCGASLRWTAGGGCPYVSLGGFD